MPLKKHFLKSVNVIIAALLSLMGFTTACDIDAPVEYGTPHAKYIVKGKVTAAKSGGAIEHIQVASEQDTTTTDANGSYQLVHEDFPGDLTFELSFTDTDGDTNGNFAPLDTTVAFTDPDFVNGDKGWYDGETEQEFNIQLKEQE